MKKTYLYVIISTFLFSSMEISLKMAGGSFSGIQLNFLRFLVGGIALLPFALHALSREHQRIHLKDMGLFAFTGLIAVVVSMSFYQVAVEVDKASTVAVVFSANPIFALIFSYLILKETLSRSNLIAVIVSIVGLLIIVNPTHLTDPLGLSLSIIAALTFGLYSIISRWGSMRHHFNGLTMTSFTFIFGAIELAILMGISHIQSIATGLLQNPKLSEFANIPYFSGITSNNAFLLLYICLGVTAGGFGFYFLAMETSNVSTASLVFFIKPALAPILALLILHEKITLSTWLGIIVIVIGSMIMFIGDRFANQDNPMPHAHH